MIVDFADPTVGPDLTADVCIVGAGPAGLVIAQQLMGTGLDVLLVESGGLQPEPDTSRLNQGENAGLPVGLEQGRARTFGGTGTVWPGQCIRLDASDFEPRSWVPDSGWPITAEGLEPFYLRAEEWLGIPAEASDEQAWRRFGLVAPAYDSARLGHKSAVYTPHPDVGAQHRQAFEDAADVRVLLHATAAALRTGEHGDVAEELEVRSLTGRVGHVHAARFVLATGGIENARLLLLSDLGNEHDVVGRYFQDHPTLWVDVASDRSEALQEFYGELGRGRVRYVPKIRLGWTTQRQQHLLNATATVVFDRAQTEGMAAAQELSSALQHRRRPVGIGRRRALQALRELNGVAVAGFRRFVLGRPSAAPLERTRLKILIEQAPDRSSRVSLSAELDEVGLPQARVNWRLTELERRTAVAVTDALDDELRRLGLGSLVGLDRLDDGGWTNGVEDAYHPMGTTRMSTDPRTGVVDSDCQVHGVPNVYVCGSSVFPTGGYANPTLTILALALRLADHLKVTRPGGPAWR